MLRRMLIFLVITTLLGLTVSCTGDAREIVTATPDATATIAAQPSPTLLATPTLEGEGNVTATVASPAGPTPTVSGAQGVDRRISFAAGETSATVENAVVSGTRDRYTLAAEAGQTMRVEISSLEDNAAFQVFGPDGQPLDGDQAGGAGVWEQVLTQPGDYVIEVGPTRGNATYRLTVTIPPPTAQGTVTATVAPPSEATRIRFAPDMTSTLIEGHLEAGGRALYVMEAVEDQQMTVSVSSPDESVIMGVRGEDGTVFLPLAEGKTGLQIVALPATMDYFIELVATGAATDYQLVASASPLADLPERIEFEGGETPVTVSGTLDAGGDLDSYILNAAAGQTITIEAFPPEAPLSVYLQSEDATDFFFATEGVLVAELSRTLDYVITVSTPNAAGVTDYELRITIE